MSVLLSIFIITVSTAASIPIAWVVIGLIDMVTNDSPFEEPNWRLIALIGGGAGLCIGCWIAGSIT